MPFRCRGLLLFVPLLVLDFPTPAQIGYPVTRIISPPDMQFHPWLVGMRNAMELLLTANLIDAGEAARRSVGRRYRQVAVIVPILPSARLSAGIA